MSGTTKSVRVPRLRFPEFRDVWISSPVSGLFTFKGNNSLSRDKLNYTDGPFKNIHYGDIHTKFSQHFRADVEQVPYVNKGESHSTIRPENYCMNGDVIFADASEDMADIGKAIEIIDVGDVPLVSGLHTIFARPTKGSFAIGFVAYLFSSEGVRKQIQREAQGAKVLGLSATRLGGVLLLYPRSPTEQQKIADCLSSLDDLITLEAQKLDSLKAHKKGLMQQLFPREGETQPRLRFPEFENAGEWVSRRVSQIAKITTGTKDTQNKVEGGKYPFFVRSQTIERIDSYSYNGEAVLTSGDGVGVGKNFHYISGKFDFHQRVYCIYEFGEDVIGLFFYLYFSEHFGERVMRMSAKNSVDSVRMAMIAEMPLMLPPLPEQHRIASCLTSLDDLITAQTQKLEALKTHKKRLNAAAISAGL